MRWRYYISTGFNLQPTYHVTQFVIKTTRTYEKKKKRDNDDWIKKRTSFGSKKKSVERACFV